MQRAVIKEQLVLVLVAGLCVLAVGALSFDRWISRAKLPDLLPKTSAVVQDRHGEILRAFMVDDGRWRLPLQTDGVDPKYISHLITYEDKRFYRHGGVDVLAVLRAAGQAVLNGRVVSGASTLSMQVARLLEGGATGRWQAKLRQIRLALALERRLSKDEILGIYLKLAPFGGNVEGLRAASLTWFGKEPTRLTDAQIALLIALPQSPENRRPDRHYETAQIARDRVLARLQSAAVISVEAATAARLEDVPRQRRDFPVLAAHLTDRIMAEDPLLRVHSLTVDRDLQMMLEALVKEHARALSPLASGAALVVDHQTGAVLAAVGSADYLDVNREGFVDMTRAIRSPGSTLKPFIYGFAFDAGLAHPETLIEDRPTGFGEYAPLNFDRRFYGTVSIAESLQLSLNIPAVSVMDALGPENFLARLRRGGVVARLPKKAKPGLAIALGGVGLSLENLVQLYAAMGNGGAVVPLRYVQTSNDPGLQRRLMSAEAAWQVGKILTGLPGESYAPQARLAYKTGTSYGNRDAWAIGYDGQHVIGVWLGRPDGGAMPGVLAADVAAPLLFQSFSRLKETPVAMPAPPPATLIVSHEELPPPLKRFRSRDAVFQPAEDAPEIAFPPDGALVDLGLMLGDAMPLVIKMRNGEPPFTWIANGVPFEIGAFDRHAQFTANGQGRLEISVIDAQGRSDSVAVELR